MLSDQLTLITPTHNRSNFLRRLFRHFDEVDMPCQIIVVDSSNPDERSSNQNLVDSYSTRLNIDYSHHSLGFLKKCCIGLAQSHTPYTGFCADDDFFFTEGASPMVQFLDENANYTTVQGQVVLVSNSHKAKASLYDCELMKMIDVSQDTASQRLAFFADRAFSTFYGIHRTKPLQRAFETTDMHTCYDKSRAHTEGMLLALSVIFGKVKTLPNIHYLQETHGANESCIVPRTVDRIGASAHHDRYIQGVVQELMAASDIDEPSAIRLAGGTSHLVPGKKKPRELSVAMVAGKLQSEVSRLFLRCSRLIDSVSSSPSTSEQGAIVRSSDLFPKTVQYQLALELLQDYPNGIPAKTRMAG